MYVHLFFSFPDNFTYNIGRLAISCVRGQEWGHIFITCSVPCVAIFSLIGLSLKLVWLLLDLLFHSHTSCFVPVCLGFVL